VRQEGNKARGSKVVKQQMGGRGGGGGWGQRIAC